MTVSTNAFEPRSLARMIEIRKRPSQWYRDNYYRAGAEQHGARLVQLDVLIGGQKMAPIQRPTDASKMVAREAGSERLIRLPYMKPGRPTNAEEIIQRRAMGSHLYSDRNLVEAAQRQIGRDIEDLDDMIDRRIEFMAAQGVITGKTPLVSLDETGAVMGIDAEVDWGMPADHLVTLSNATEKWTHADSDPIANLRTWGNRIAQSSGMSATMATIGAEVAAALLKHEAVLKLLDNRRVEAGMIDLRAMDIEGINYFGRIAGIDLYEDLRTYQADHTGTATPYTPVDRVVLGTRNAENRIHYGPISDLKCPTPITQRWPKTWETDEPSQRFVAVHASPLPALHQPDAFVSAKVL
ncbi:major capsid protein [Thiocapsa sp. UBA6158]|jgi:hypothetical protein|uniref:major capsid protein n=1 Tax=Thiocapsa sp. UBA6158 TaxID=1947692 RepID=UPI0025D0A999|nr:major capsid protein [Thiocapsa sp. UBA6158]